MVAARGEHRATDAARQAIASPLLEANIEGARGILFNVSGPSDLRLREVRLAADAIRERADPDANVIFGASFNEALGGDVLITLIATGLTGRSPAGAVSADDQPQFVEAASAVEPAPAVEPAAAVEPAPPSSRRGRSTRQRPSSRRRSSTPDALAKRPARTPKAAPTAEPKLAAVMHVQPRSSVGPDAPDPASDRSRAADETDLDVPSFLRQRDRPTSST